MSALTAVDRFLGVPARAVARSLRAVLGGGLEATRPLVVRPGGLGDFVVATAALENVGIAPDAVDWLVESRSAPWAQELGLLHACYDRFDDAFRTLVIGRRTLVIDLEQRYGLSSAAATALAARGGTVVGFETNRGRGAYDVTVAYDQDEHELLAFQRIFSRAFNRVPPPPRQRRPTATRQGPTVLAIGGTSHPSRQLEVDDWLYLAQSSAVVPQLIVCAPADRALAMRLRERLPNDPDVACGFSPAVEALRAASRVVTIDGGLVHVASYFGTPVDAVFTAGRSAKWAPWSAGSTMLKRTDLACQPCTLFGAVPSCPHGFACKDRLRWQRVRIPAWVGDAEYVTP